MRDVGARAMKFNDRELIRVANGRVDVEGVLHYQRPQEKDWTDWQQPTFKERYFKLVANMLFYYRLNDAEPVGVLVLENAQVAYERPHRGVPFAFTLSFKVGERPKDREAKHVFSCRCQGDVNKWVAALKVASCEYWRTQFIILKTKISMKTGRDPVLDYLRQKNNENATVTTKSNKNVCAKKSTFRSHVHTQHVNETSTATTTTKVTRTGLLTEQVEESVTRKRNTETVVVANLIDL